jgi:hypothetical protein
MLAPEPSTFQYYLHTPHIFEDADGAQSFHVRGDAAQCAIDLIAPGGLDVTLFEGYDPPMRPPYDERIQEHHLKAETTDTSERAEFIALLRTGRAGAGVPTRAEHVEHPAGHALRVALPDGEAIVLLRRGEGELSGWGLSTDGDVAAVRLDAVGEPIDFFGHGGATVRWQGSEAPGLGGP